MEAALGAKFEVLFQTLFVKVSHFVVFCNLVNVLDAPAAAKKTKKMDRRLDRTAGRGLTKIVDEQ